MELKWKPVWFAKPSDDGRDRGLNVYPDKSGVYLYSEVVDDSRVIRYVGQSDNLQRRQGEHRDSSEPNTKLKKLYEERVTRDLNIHYAECDEEYLDCIEHKLYEKYKHHGLYNDPDKIPNCNKKFEINFPELIIKQ